MLFVELECWDGVKGGGGGGVEVCAGREWWSVGVFGEFWMYLCVNGGGWRPKDSVDDADEVGDGGGRVTETPWVVVELVWGPGRAKSPRNESFAGKLGREEVLGMC